MRFVITAGPTREAIDPVRFITNHSSGKMGYALARQACYRGADVVLISGPVQLKAPDGVKLVPITTAQQMLEAMQQHYTDADVVIKSAAVADYRPKTVAEQKIKKTDGDMVLELERNADILAWLGAHKTHQILVGFAAETNDVEQNALGKLKRKGLDFIAANDVTAAHSGFGKDTNQVTLFGADGSKTAFPVLSKDDTANRILDVIKEYKIRKQFRY